MLPQSAWTGGGEKEMTGGCGCGGKKKDDKGKKK